MSTHDEDTERRKKVALFRYGLIADLLHWPRGKRGLGAAIAAKAEHDYEIPGSRRSRIAPETIRDWLKAYRRGGGFDALLPKPRADQGQARAIPQEVADLLCLIKEDKRELSVRMVIDCARASGEVPEDLELVPATVHRLLSGAGLIGRVGLKEATSKDRRRFSYEKAGELWMSDVMHGPAVTTDGKRKRKAYLISFIDDATRVVPYAAFALGENVACFLPVFEEAIRRRGIPKRLFVDNGSAYRSQHLCLVCAKLGVTLIHARPYQPAGKGKQERWYREVRRQCLATLREEDTRSLEALNRKLWAWVEGEYHRAPHKGLGGEAPFDRWAAVSDEVRLPEPGLDLGDLFLFEEKRKVHKDRTVSLRGVVYEADAALVGETVTLRFDPSRLGKTVEIWHKGRKVEVARRVDVYANCFVKRNNERRSALDVDGAPPPPPEGLRLRDFGEHRSALDVDGVPPPPPEGLRLRDFGVGGDDGGEKGGR
jgi:putative transposase